MPAQQLIVELAAADLQALVIAKPIDQNHERQKLHNGSPRVKIDHPRGPRLQCLAVQIKRSLDGGTRSALLAAKPERVRELVANNDHDELVSIALIQQNKHVVREGGGIASIVNMLPSGGSAPGDEENSHSGAAREAPVFRSLAAPTAPAHHAISASTTSPSSAELSLTTNTVVSAPLDARCSQHGQPGRHP